MRHLTILLLTGLTLMILAGCSAHMLDGRASKTSPPNSSAAAGVEDTKAATDLSTPNATPGADVAGTRSGKATIAATGGQPAVMPVANFVGGMNLFGQVPTPAPTQADAGMDNLRQVTAATEGADFDPDIDATGKWLVFASTRHRNTSDIYLQRIDSTAVTQLTNDRSNNVMPAFSPDGKRVAFSSDRSGNWDIYVMPADGGQPQQITNSASQDIHPSFSPDGRFLVYCSQPPRSNGWELAVVELDKPANRKIIGQGLFPHWSPQGTRIVFQRARERGSRWFSIWTVEQVDGEWIRPTEIAASSNAAAITPHWSPDGKHIVFCTVVNPDQNANPQGKPAQADIWIVSAEGSGLTNLTQNRAVNVQPVWAHDGAIYFVSNRAPAGSDNVWSLRPDRALGGSQPTTAKLSPPQVNAPERTATVAPSH